MKYKFLGTVLVAASLLAADSGTAPRTDAQIAKKVRHELMMYPRYTIWDDISFRVNNGQVELLGAVTQPYKKDDVNKIVKQVAGVTSVTSEIKVLPLSDFDDRLRLQVARAIYSDPAFTQYAMMPVPPVHIIVDNGHVTLIGAVATNFEKAIAGLRANGTGLSFSVVNNLQVEHPAKKS
jgi:hyperosmotically inducible protein